MTSIYYIETSVLLQILFQERGWKESYRRVAESERLISSRLVRVEAGRTLLRLKLRSPQDELTASELVPRCNEMLAKIDLVEMSQEVCMRAERVFPSYSLRSLDAIHVATFLMIKEKFAGIEMLSNDSTVRQALRM